MKTNYEIRYAAHPEDAKSYDTKRIRRDFLIERVFAADEVNMVYSMYDRMIVGGAMPVSEELKLEAIDPLKAEYFTTPGIKGWFQKKFFTGAGQVPIDRSGANAAQPELRLHPPPHDARRLLPDHRRDGSIPHRRAADPAPDDGRSLAARQGDARCPDAGRRIR